MCNNGADVLQAISIDALRKQCSDPDNTPNNAPTMLPTILQTKTMKPYSKIQTLIMMANIRTG